MQLRRRAPGPEREALANSFWFLGGSGALLLALAVGVEPFKLPISVRWALLGVSAILTTVGSVKARRLAAARRQQILADGREAKSLPDRVEALEALGALDRGPPTRVRVMLLGSKLMVAGTFVWIANIIRSPTMVAVMGSLAVGHVLWAGADLVGIGKARKARLVLDQEIDALLPAPKDLGS
jgi:hypothetical protein